MSLAYSNFLIFWDDASLSFPFTHSSLDTHDTR